MNVKFNVIGLEKVQDFMKSVPKGVKAAAMRAISEFIVGDEHHGLKHDVSYKYVSRKAAYPPTGFVSDKQRRFVMASLNDGSMKIGRPSGDTKMSKSWRWEQKGSQWDRTNIMGRIPFSGFPSRHNKMVGWRHYMDVVNQT